jgi:ACT domain-containing protein
MHHDADKIPEIHVHIHHHHHESDPEVLERLDDLAMKQNLLQELMESIMPTLDELQAKAAATLAKVTSDTDIDNAVATVVNNQNATIADLRSQLAAAGQDPVKLQALSDTMDNILAIDTANAQKVADAVTAGTPV